ncbi:3-methyl-2-oxobutanoate hydroxymethyltransferase [Roseateles sp.]|uniref:3-methyl-2-oxobutanoate hydroxymethyltransferase n=1 Tax=Roseateles sp. TaxID=1971397 RepID=UPI0039EB883D
MTTDRKPMTLPRLAQMHASGEKITMLTCYDAAFASLLDEAGVDILLIGDSLGNVLQGRGSTAPVSLEDMVYHTFCVSRGHKWAWIIADLPFDSYHVSKEEAWKSAAALVKAGAHMVKLEGGGWTAETVRFISERGIPVCCHLGFTPQTVNALGGFKVQGRDEAGAARMKRESMELVEAGAAMLLYEMVPAALAAEITATSPVPVIGIGAGVGTSGQVLVLHDMLNITPGRKPRFVKDFMAGKDSVLAAVKGYVDEVKAKAFPVNEIHGF